MPTPLPVVPATRPSLRCLVVRNPLSMLAASLFLFGILLLLLGVGYSATYYLGRGADEITA